MLDLDNNPSNDSNGFDDLGDMFGFSNQVVPPPPVPTGPVLSLKQTSDMDPNSFQQKWMSLGAYPLIQK